MNEEMKVTWLEISQMLGYPTQQQQDVFLRTWQRAIQAEREECAKVCEAMNKYMDDGEECAVAIRARGHA